MARTYVDRCLKEGRVARWPDAAMPIRVYIAPFRWYEQSKQQESFVYQQMILEAMDAWTRATQEKVRFRVVNRLHDSQIDIKWRRVDRNSLGHCEYVINDRSQIYSAEISIGISDGRVHARYNDTDEVRHTILHEFGHALGLLDHSDQPKDIMYVPHQYGVVELSARDIASVQLLYRLPPGFDYLKIGKKRQLPEPFTFHDVIAAIENSPQHDKPFLPKGMVPRGERPEVLADQHRILSEMGKFHLSTQNIRISPDVRRFLLRPGQDPPEGPMR